jgi:archaeal flagellin FlaB
MNKRFANIMKSMHRSQKGITGLETAIILIAFVTVASVLAYSVLSAGIFSAEKGKQTVYSGLAQAQSSMQLRGSVYGLSEDNVNINEIQFTLASVLGDEAVDMTDSSNGTNTVVINYSDKDNYVQDVDWTKTTLGQERGGVDLLEPGEAMLITVTVPEDADITSYSTFTLQIVPTKGAAITIQRSLPASILSVNDLN